MPRLTAADEYFFHQIPEPLSNVMVHHPHWRESLYFVAHPQHEDGDVIVLTLARFPERDLMDSLQMGRVDNTLIMAKHERACGSDPHGFVVGPVEINIIEPFRRVSLKVDGADAPVSLDMTFDARGREHAFRRGTMRHQSEIIWDQSHMIQSGSYSGSYRYQGIEYRVDDWWGQRDHSWGIRNHARCPFWMWLAIQLPDGMLGVWCWEYADGTRIYTDGCFAPADHSKPIPLRSFEHDLHWLDTTDSAVSYGLTGDSVAGLEGEVQIRLADGQAYSISGRGYWHSRYGNLGGGQLLMMVTTSDGRQGSAAYELTGAHHHRYFPEARSVDLPAPS